MLYKKKIEGIDYKFRDDLNGKYPENVENMAIIQLLTGEYCDILYCYGRTNIETVDTENGILKFQFKLFDTSKTAADTLAKDQNFIQHIGEILNSIIIDDMEKNSA